MSNLTTRQDDWSFQVMATTSKRFFVRITSPKDDTSSMIFSDFRLEHNDNALALEALTQIREQFYGPASGMTLVFEDIYPAYRDTNDQDELIRRRKQIVAVLELFASRFGLKLESEKLVDAIGKLHVEVQIK